MLQTPPEIAAQFDAAMSTTGVDEYQEQVLRFLSDPQVPFTNVEPLVRLSLTRRHFILLVLWKWKRQTSHSTSLYGVILMQTWAVQDAKSRFSEFLDACLAKGPQVVTRRGAETAVLVPIDVWKRLQAAAKPSLKDLLLSDSGRGDLVLPKRGQVRRRPVEEVI